MKAVDFNLAQDLILDPGSGIASFKNTRLVVLDANALGLLRNDLIQELGMEQARKFFLRFGYQHGYSDFMQMKLNYEFDTEIDLLASGPVIHSWEGLVQATPRELRFDRATGEFFFTGVWRNSYEADQHLSYFPKGPEPVCWSLMGYASGWCTAFFNKNIIAIEPVCRGKGDEHCEWLIKPVEEWGVEAGPYIEALRIFQENSNG